MPVVTPAVTAHTPAAVRKDSTGLYREETAFLQHLSERLYAVTYVPAQPSGDTGLVICSSVLVEHLTNYRREVLLARRLAAGGMFVQRFHYRGAGHSTGNEAEATLASMVDDAAMVAERFKAQAGLRLVAFMGSRLGAIVAAQSARDPGAPLVFWQPAIDADRYFRELIRARLLQELRDGAPDGAPDAWKAEMAERGVIEILGHRLYRPLFEGARGVTLQALLPQPAPPVLLVQMGRGATVQPETERLGAWIGEHGGTVRIEVVADDPAWLFVGQRTMKSVDEPVELTARWLLAEVARG